VARRLSSHPDNLPLFNPGVYRIWHLESGKSYVGASTCVASRLLAHSKGHSGNPRLQEIFKAGGFAAEPLFYATSCKCDLAKVEAALITEFDCIANGYNRRTGRIWLPMRFPLWPEAQRRADAEAWRQAQEG